MKLTGEAKELFRQYYEKLPPHTPNHVPYATFMGLHPSMQFGVYQDWADSMGLDMITEASLSQERYWFTIYSQDKKQDNLNDDCFETRQEARDGAIEKLNELINNG